MIERKEKESFIAYAERLIDGKQSGLYDIDYVEMWKLLFNEEISSDEARKRLYGVKRVIKEFENCDIEQQRVEYEKSKIKFQDQRNEFKKVLRESARFDHLKEEIHKSILELSEEKPLKINVFSSFAPGNREAALILSDWHLGLVVNNYLNIYNKEIFKKRIKKLVEKTIEYGTEHKINTLHCMILSDLVEGILRIKTRIASEEDIIKQIQIVSETLAEMFVEFASVFKNIKVYSVLDNHSRVTPNKEESIVSENFSYLITWYLQARLQQIDNIEFIKNEYDDEIIVTDICGQKIFALHGHLDDPKDVVQNMTLMIKEIPQYVIIGHLHRNFADEIHGVEVIMNPSLSGVSEYSKEIRKTSKPAQKLLIFDKNEGLLCSYSIRL